MATEVRIVPGTTAHAEALLPLLRDADVAEGLALGQEPREVLMGSLALSEVSYAALFNGEVGALCGVVPLGQTVLGSADRGQVWMLSGRAVAKHPRAFLRASRVVMDEFLRRYRVLGNIIDGRYTGALQWAAWLGVTFHSPIPVGPGVFIPFTIRRP